MAENVNLDIAEYNAFGPWAYEISDKYPLPRLFAPYFAADDNAVLKIKIPREIERRNASPGMDLYDYVVALYEDSLLVLERRDDKAVEHRINLKDFKGIRIYENMLKGGYTIYSAEEAISFPFNAVSIDLFQKLTNLVLEKAKGMDVAGSTVQVSSLPVTDTVPESMLLTNMLHDIQMKVRLLWKEMNPEALHTYTDQYLVVLENGVFPNRVAMQEFGYTQTIIPFNRISGLEVVTSEEYSLMQECVISLGSSKVVYHFDVYNEEVAEFYNAFK